MKKIILLILAAALAALPVLSCAADEDSMQWNGPAEPGEPAPADRPEPDTENEAAAEEPEDALTFPDLPDVNFGGYEFRILNTGDEHQLWIMKTLVAEEETGSALNDAIFRRNRRMEERFGFTLVQRDFNGPGLVRDAARRSIQAASDDFDLAMMEPAQGLMMAQEGMLEMIDRIPHVDLSRPWWDRAMVRDFSIGNRIFLASGDFSFNQYSITMGTLFNKQIHADLGLDCPYQLVREGRWTIDRFTEMGRAALRDLNGDGVFDHNDQWGLVSNANNYTLALMIGMGARYVIKDADDMPVFNLNTEGFINRFETLFDMVTDGWVYDFNRPNTPTRPPYMFMNNQGLFWINPVQEAVLLRAMDTDFGILPQPKLNEQQEDYISATVNPHIMGIPVTTGDLERTGIILEALNAESRLTTLEIYFDTMLVNQLMNRDEESAEMLDIIFANRVYDLGRLFWNDVVANTAAHTMRDLSRDIVSAIERTEAAANAAIEAAIAAFVDN